jgi:hypothetical protein
LKLRHAAGNAFGGGSFHALTEIMRPPRLVGTTDEYHLSILTPEGNVKEHYALKSADAADARLRAKKFLTTYPVELWDGARCVARFPSKVASRK